MNAANNLQLLSIINLQIIFGMERAGMRMALRYRETHATRGLRDAETRRKNFKTHGFTRLMFPQVEKSLCPPRVSASPCPRVSLALGIS